MDIPWRSPLEGELRERARSIVTCIAEDIERTATPVPTVGDADAALFFAYLAAETREERWIERCRLHLAAAVDAVATMELHSGLLGGFVGVAWVVEHVARWGPIAVDDDMTHAIGDALMMLLEVESWSGAFDLVGGLVGMGVYALELRDEGRRRLLVERVIHHLEALVEERCAGVTWPTKGHVDLGVAHGVPGVLAFLGRAHRAGFGSPRTRARIDAGMQWTLGQRLEGTTLPYEVGPNVTSKNARTAWCYGNPGAALALSLAAVDDADAREATLAMAEHAAGVERAVSGVQDHGFCHGSLGVAHMFQRLFAATGSDVLRDAARRWYVLAIAKSTIEPGSIPYQAYDPIGRVWVDDRSLVMGTAGIGLVLLAATSDRDPAWDRLFLCSP